jgi:phage repressor protein C with HTH and peptisase S24 domain
MLESGMADDDWFGRLKEAIADDGRAAKTISLAAGLGQNFVQQMLAREQPPKQASLDKLLDVLGPEAAAKVRGTPLPRASEVREADVPMPYGMKKDVPVLGTAAGSDFGKGAFQLSSDPVDYVRRPPGLLATKDVYALYVEGESMSPKFDAGDLIYVNPNRPIRPGDYVVIQEPVDGDTIRGFVKLFEKRAGDWYVVRQFNPPAEMRFPAKDNAVKLHRVLTTADLMGV